MTKYDIDVWPVTRRELKRVLKAIPFPIEGHDLAGDGKLRCWAEFPLPAKDDAERHAEVVVALPDKAVASRWRCTEYDAWDSTFDPDTESD